MKDLSVILQPGHISNPATNEISTLLVLTDQQGGICLFFNLKIKEEIQLLLSWDGNNPCNLINTPGNEKLIQHLMKIADTSFNSQDQNYKSLMEVINLPAQDFNLDKTVYYLVDLNEDDSKLESFLDQKF